MPSAGFRAALVTAALAGTIAGLLISSQLHLTPPAFTGDERGLLGGMPGLVPGDFVAVSKRVTPAVFSITTSKVVRSGPGRFHGFEDLFGPDFFGMPRQPRTQRSTSLGSGVLVTADGLAVTNNHVVEGADSIEAVLTDKRRFRATIVGTDPKTDMAVIRLENGKDLPTVPWGESEKVQVGEWVLAIGNPLGLSSTVTAGIISAAGRADVGVAEFEDFLQTDAAINQGNSGGALVNLRGELIGINTAIASTGRFGNGGSIGIGFAIPSRMARTVMESLVTSGKVVRGYLGVALEPMTTELARSFKWTDANAGVLVAQVQPGTPAAVAGFQDGDIIVSLNGRKVDDLNRFRNRIALTPPGTKVQLEVFRDGKTLPLEATLSELPSSPQEGPRPAPEPAPALERLGFQVRTMTPRLADRLGLGNMPRGAVVMEVDPGSAASEAGLAPGDVIIAMNRRPVASADDVSRLAADMQPGDSVLLRVQRGNTSRYLAFRLQ